jgi:ParB family chromosome partitioning protein
VADEVLADLPPGGHDVEHALGQAGLGRDLGQDVGVERGLGRGLEDQRAARRQRRRHLEHGDEQRHVPGDDGADHADRLAADGRGPQDAGPLLLEGVAPGQVGVVVEDHDRRPRLGADRPADRRAVLDGDQAGDVLGSCFQRGRDGGHHLGPLGRRALGPGALVERSPGRGDRPVDVGGAGVGDPADDLLGVGGDDLDDVRAVGLDPLAADEEVLASRLRRLGRIGHVRPPVWFAPLGRLRPKCKYVLVLVR